MKKEFLKLHFDTFIYFIIIILLVSHAIYINDYIIALLSAICGISYTFWAGKGYALCYIIGLLGSVFYCILSVQNSIWGNLALYILYYIPMQIYGYFSWNKNLKKDTKVIIKERLAIKNFIILITALTVLSLICSQILIIFRDSHPVLDSFSTIFSIAGMYLTVKRKVEQWIFWIIVNSISLFMWLRILLSGKHVASTVLMWVVYLMLAFYFWGKWNFEIVKDKQE